MAWAAWTGRGGGSTITQQLAKFTWLSPERSLTRKAQEALIALWIESWLTKDEILERYLSNAYFGDNQYGLRAASLHYFYRKPENLKPEQAAMLAGLLQAPSRYNPTKHYDRAKTRMDLVVAAPTAPEPMKSAVAIQALLDMKDFYGRQGPITITLQSTFHGYEDRGDVLFHTPSALLKIFVFAL